MNRGKKLLLFLLSAVAMMCGGFCMGAGMSTILGDLNQENGNQMMNKEWNQDDKTMVGDQELDRRNQKLSEGMEYVAMERELYAREKELHAEARIVVDGQSRYGCTVSVIRDATGETIYRSGLIEPGCYIEKIPLQSTLKKGYYPCTAIWGFYTEDDEYAGEMAWKVTVIIR